MLKRFIYVAAALLLISILSFVLKKPILRAFGNYLIYEEPISEADALYILGGGPFNRGNEAVRIFNKGFAPSIICTGENVYEVIKSLGFTYYESELTIKNLKRQGIPDSVIILMAKGTSTQEESNYILEHCMEQGIDTCIILSSKFHTRRIKNVFLDKFRKEGIHVIIRGAPAGQYDEQNWWEKEAGMIALNNEYIKLVYYFFVHDE